MTGKVVFLAFLLMIVPIPLDAHPQPFPPVDILIDIGHGGVDSGTVYGSIAEKEINLAVGRKLYEQLKQSGYNVLMNRTTDIALSDDNSWLQTRSRHKRDLAQRTRLAAEMSPLLMVSLHVNWSKDPTARGPHVLYQKSNQSYWLANTIQQSLNHLYGMKKGVMMGRQYYLLNHTNCPTVIVEMGFLSNRSDREALQQEAFQQRLAEAIASAIQEYLTLTGEMREETSPNWFKRWMNQVKATLQEWME